MAATTKERDPCLRVLGMPGASPIPPRLRASMPMDSKSPHYADLAIAERAPQGLSPGRMTSPAHAPFHRDEPGGAEAGHQAVF
jgi:hypothetical protein